MFQYTHEVIHSVKCLGQAALIAGGVVLASSPLAAGAMDNQWVTEKWSIENLDQPESVVIEHQSGRVFISNINGQPMALNGKGYISLADENGNLVQKQWAKGMDAPKGMAIAGNYLYVADMQSVHIVDLKTGETVKQLKAANAKMLNDVTATPDGTVYISDMAGGGIYRIQDDTLELWFSSDQLPHPNGLLWHQGGLLVAGWGVSMRNDFTTEQPGTLYQMDVTNPVLKAVSTGYQLGNLDGVVAINDALYVSDWISGELFVLVGKERRKVLSPGAGLADIGVSGNTLYAPMMMDNRVVAWQVAE